MSCKFYMKVREEEGTAEDRTKFLRFISNEYGPAISNRMKYASIKAGQRFVTQGEDEDSAYIIQKGSCIVIVEKDGELFPVNHYGKGDIVGGLGLLTGEPRRAHVEAETNMDVWVLKREDFKDISAQNPEILSFLTEVVADRFDSRRPVAYRSIGKYITTDIVGRGAFSIVYKGIHQGLNMPVAIKMMRHDLAMNDDFLNSFHNEAKLIASLNHANIIKIYDIEERYRTVFIIMEHVDGGSLRDMLDKHGTIPQKLAVHYIVQICMALGYAHQRGIIHRDINPTNILIEANDQLKILDFGLACPEGTQDYSNAGTAFYMAPEQIEGAPVDGRTDIYAMGICAYEMITGKKPFVHSDLTTLMNMHLEGDFPDPAESVPDLAPPLRRFILKATDRDPNQRFASAEQALEMLQPMMPSQPGVYHHPEPHRLKVSSMFLLYREEHRLELKLLIEDFYTRAKALGMEVRVADFKDL